MSKKEERFSELSSNIEKLIGGKENVQFLSNCMTRLRFVVVDKSKVKEEKIKNIKGVKGTAWAGDQFQIIIGQAVDQALAEIQEATGIGLDNQKQPESKKHKKFNPMSIFETIAAIMTPIITLLIGAGVIRVVMILLSYFGVITTDSSTYIALDFIADSAYYFLPVIVGAASAQRFGMNIYVGMFLGAILLHPKYITLVQSGDAGSLFGLPIYETTYANTLFPVILNVMFATQVEKIIKKYSPDLLRTILVPFGTILITTPIALSVLSPIGAYIGIYISEFVIWIYETVGFIGVGIVAALYPIFVSVGMHNAFTPYLSQQITLGSESLLSPAVIVNNIGIGAACLGIGIKSKNSDIKTEATSSAVTAIAGGITEPGLYGFVLGNKKVLFSVMLGNFIGGCIAGVFKSTANAFAGSYGLLGLTVFINNDGLSNVLYTTLAVLVGAVISFVSTIFLYKSNSQNDSSDSSLELTEDKQVVYTPIKGEVKLLRECRDDAFSQGALGQGVVIEPSEGKVFAPFDGKVIMLFNTLHAIGLQANNGIELMIHVGLNTVELNGDGFIAHVKSGDVIHKGQLLLEFDLPKFKSKNIDVMTPVVITNSDSYKVIIPTYGEASVGDKMINIEK